MFMEERHQAILNHVKAAGRISIGEIQETFGVSPDSARRDLRVLEERGLLKRTHGGAIPLRKVDDRPPRVRELTPENIQENYLRIAKAGAALVEPGDCVYLNNGSVGYLALRFLPRDFEYTLVVNSPALANELKLWDNVAVYVTGGLMRMRSNASLVDGFAAAFIRNMQLDLCLMTGAGIDADFGFSNGSEETAVFQRAVLEHSRRKALLMAGPKVGFRAFIKVCDAKCYDTLITDWIAPEDELAKLEELGLEVKVVEEPTP